MNLGRHKNTLLRNLGEDAISMLTTSNAIIAGGAITSIFSGAEVNDYDIYFRSKKDIITFIRNAYNSEGDLEDGEDPFPLSEEDFLDMSTFEFTCQNHTSRSITFTHNDLVLQLIHFEFFQDVTDIFKSYDFHINMAAYDFSTSQFVLHDKFVTDIAERRLTFNKGTRYPIMSSLRVSKYLERGYKISKKEMFKIGMAISDLNITSWEELEDQLSGFYGIDVSEFFDHSVPFTMEDAFSMIETVHEYLDKPTATNPTIEMLFFTVLGNPYANQRIFFKYIRKINGVYVDNNNHEQTFTLDQSSYFRKDVTVYPSIDDVPSAYYYRTSNAYYAAVIEVEDDCKFDMTHQGLTISGNIKLLAIKELD